MLASAIAWPSLNQYPTNKQEENRSPTVQGPRECMVTSDSQPGAPWPLTHTFMLPSQVGCIECISYKSQPLGDLEMGTKASYYYQFSKTSLNECVTKNSFFCFLCVLFFCLSVHKSFNHRSLRCYFPWDCVLYLCSI